MVCGSRFLDLDNDYLAPISRRTGIHLFAFLLSRIVDRRITDPTSGFRLYNRRAIELFARDYPHDYPEVEAVLMLHHHRLGCARCRCGCSRAAAAFLDHSGSPLTTWSRFCWRCSSAWRADAGAVEPGGATVAAEHGI